MIYRLALISWLSVGFLIDQFLHAFAYKSGGSISSIFNLQLSINLSYYLSFVILAFCFLTIWLTFNTLSKKPLTILFPFILIEVVSQLAGISIIKFGFELLLILGAIINLSIEKNYNVHKIKNKNLQVISIYHNEIMSLLKISISVTIFLFSAVGISLAFQFLQKYYNTEFFPRILFWYGILIIYIILGYVFFITYVLFVKMNMLRNAFELKSEKQITKSKRKHIITKTL